MRVAILSDVHGNAVALDAALGDVGEADAVVCLGDVAENGPQPAECVDRLRAIGCPVVMGNTDQWLLDMTTEGEERWRVDTGRWTLEQLGEERLRWMSSFTPTIELDLGGERLLCFHATPRSNTEAIQPTCDNAELAHALGDHGARVRTGGHTHTQWLRRVHDWVYFNPGSVGMAIDATHAGDKVMQDPVAEYAILDTARGRLGIEFRRVAYERDEVVEAIRVSGMPHADFHTRRWLERRRA